MARFHLPVFPRHFLNSYVALSMVLFYLANAMLDTTVQVTVARPKGGDNSLPDQLSLAIQDDSGWQTDLVLTRAKYIEPNIPVYTYCGGHQSGSDYQLADLEDSQNVAYYQSAQHQASIEVTTVESSEHKFDYLLEGELLVNGTRCSLVHKFQSKRDVASSSPLADDVVYTLHELPPVVGIDDVVIDHPSTRQQRGFPQAQTRDLSSRAYIPDSGDRKRFYGDDIFIDVVAVVDFKKYSEFKQPDKPRQEALNALRRYYVNVFNGVNVRYQNMDDSQYSISVRLVDIYVDELSEAPWSSENYLLDSNQVDGNSLDGGFIRLAQGEEGNQLYPNDHLMYFTGYDLLGEIDGTLSALVLGLATPSTVCYRGSTSIIEDTEQGQTIVIAAHELGHALSASHDSDGNNCLDTGFLMSPGLTDSKFSPCSVQYFHNYIEGWLDKPHGQQCLLEWLPLRNVESSFSSDRPGLESSRMSRRFIRTT